MARETTRHTFVVSLVLCLVCSFLVSGAAVALRDLQEENQTASRRRNILMAAFPRELPDEDRNQIIEIALAHEGVRGLHDLRTRSSGVHVFIQMHLEMDGEITLNEAHVIADAVELDLLRVFPNAEVIVHEDPEGVEEVRKEFA